MVGSLLSFYSCEHTHDFPRGSAMSPSKMGSTGLQPIADIDRLVHEPARLMILAILHVVESADFLFLLHQTGLTRGNLSSHSLLHVYSLRISLSVLF